MELVMRPGNISIRHILVMEDIDLTSNSDWDPCYLDLIFSQDFFDMSELWNDGSASDLEIVNSCVESQIKEIYDPILEDITLDDDELLSVVTDIESQ